MPRCLPRCLNFDCVDRAIHMAMKVLGPLMSLGALVLISIVVYCYFESIYPATAKRFHPILHFSSFFFGLWLLLNILFNYLMAVFVGPGYPPSGGHELPQQVLQLLSFDPGLERGYGTRFCKRCNQHKPWRTHHCSVCARCVLKMDHHCPWVNNCVGYKNYRYFVLFLIYLWAGTGYVLVLGMDTFYRVMNKPHHSLYVFQYVLCIGVHICMILFLLFHGYLVLSNQSTIELWSNRSDRRAHGIKNPYYLSIFRNLSEVFGYVPWYKWLVPSKRDPPGNGMIYPVTDRLQQKFNFDFVEIGLEVSLSETQPLMSSNLSAVRSNSNASTGNRPARVAVSNGPSLRS